MKEIRVKNFALLPQKSNFTSEGFNSSIEITLSGAIHTPGKP